MSMDSDNKGSQCPTCGYPRFTNEHSPECPARNASAEKVPEASADAAIETKEARLAAARKRLKDFADETKEEIDDAVRTGKMRSPQEHRANSGEIAEARQIIEELLAAEDLPKVTVDRKHLATILSEGLKERPTAYQKEVSAIVGTLGREPLLPEGEDRVILELALTPEELGPRFTGPARVFEGIVAVRGNQVPPDKIRVIDPKKPVEKGEEPSKAA